MTPHLWAGHGHRSYHYTNKHTHASYYAPNTATSHPCIIQIKISCWPKNQNKKLVSIGGGSVQPTHPPPFAKQPSVHQVQIKCKPSWATHWWWHASNNQLCPPSTCHHTRSSLEVPAPGFHYAVFLVTASHQLELAQLPQTKLITPQPN